MNQLSAHPEHRTSPRAGHARAAGPPGQRHRAERRPATVQPTDRRRQKALDRWFAGFAAQIRSHHELVDTLVVPSLAARGALDERSLDTLADDHAWIDELLCDLGDALGVLSFGLGAESWWLGKAVRPGRQRWSTC